ncbi:MAG TPA: IclR family transcriptional regulator C-terminal domain-containing protein [Pseudonocardia sp.]|jgi:DNA-binding IclR family transcriptional regulator|nr:IclR family transcriptional regulator C-terminal domain-containing protein [Pseudonocardia sp.]
MAARARAAGREPAGHEPKAVQKAFLLLEAVAQLGSGASARELSRLSGIPPATAYRLLNLLVADGFLVRTSDLSGFALGRRTRELAGVAGSTEVAEARGDFRPVPAIVEELRAQVRFGIYAVAYTGDQVRLVDRDPDHELISESALLTHLHASAAGKLLLAQHPELAGARPLRPLTARTIVEPERLAAELTAVRAAGLAREVDETRLGRSALAVPVRDRRGGLIGCLVAIGRTGRIRVDDNHLADLLHSYAARAQSS